MCELFGVSGKQPVIVNQYLREFVSHSVEHPDGWGLAMFYGNAVSVEKEPIAAYKSTYLKERLTGETAVQTMMGHIRLATKGVMEYGNCHPFVKRDNMRRAWTLIHNGTIFESAILDPYVHVQKGSTDSERILLYIVDEIDKKQSKKGEALTREERFQILDQILCQITPPNNKVNLMVYDSEVFYVHTNMKATLYYKRDGESIFFATTPLDQLLWTPVKMNTLLAYEDGNLTRTGTDHGNEYIYDEEAMRYLFLDMSNL